MYEVNESYAVFLKVIELQTSMTIYRMIKEKKYLCIVEMRRHNLK